MGAVRDCHATQDFLNSLMAFFLRNAQVFQWQFYVLLHIQFVNQVEALEHETYLSLADFGTLTLLERTYVLPVSQILSAGGIVEQSQYIQ